nr:CDP-diacylglycerol--serine O-phosphatidyltransferase [Bacteroidota bacterium]
MIKKNIPNTVTLLNLISGCISIVFAFKGEMIHASVFIGIAAFFDFFDGLLARLLNAKSPIGLQLDSLADMVSFGVAPSVILFRIMETSNYIPTPAYEGIHYCSFSAFLLAAFGAIRLAKFNIDTRQTSSFLGLPIPANALFFAAFPLVIYQAEILGITFLTEAIHNFWVLFVLILVFSGLMVSELPLFSLKFDNLSWNQNAKRYLFLICSSVLILTLKFISLPLIVVFYVLLSIFWPDKPLAGSKMDL